LQLSVVTCKEFVFGDEFEGTCEEDLQRVWFYFWLHRGNWLTFILIILERFVERRFRLVSHLPSLLYFWFQFWCLSELKDPRPLIQLCCHLGFGSTSVTLTSFSVALHLVNLPAQFICKKIYLKRCVYSSLDLVGILDWVLSCPFTCRSVT